MTRERSPQEMKSLLEEAVRAESAPPAAWVLAQARRTQRAGRFLPVAGLVGAGAAGLALFLAWDPAPRGVPLQPVSPGLASAPILVPVSLPSAAPAGSFQAEPSLGVDGALLWRDLPELAPFGALKISGSILPRDALNALRPAAHNVEGCFEAALLREPGLSGTFAASLLVEGSRIERVRALQPVEEEFASCALDALAKVRGLSVAGGERAELAFTLPLVNTSAPAPLAPVGDEVLGFDGEEVKSPARTTAALRSVVLLHLPEITACYVETRRTKPSLEGKLSVSIRVDAAGRAALTIPGGAGLAPVLDACVEQVVEGLRFPKGEEVDTFTHAFHFRLQPSDPLYTAQGSAEGSASQLLKEARAAVSRKEYSQALGKLSEAVELDASNPEIYRLMTISYQNIGSLDAACDSARQYLKLAGKEGAQSKTFMRYLDEQDAALYPSCEVRDLDPLRLAPWRDPLPLPEPQPEKKDATEKLAAAQGALDAGDAPRALYLLSEALVLESRNPEIYRMRASIYMAKGDQAEACHAIKRYVEFSGTSPQEEFTTYQATHCGR